MKAAVLVEPEIPENTGSIARLAHNYGYQLRVVNPGFNLAEARKTAKNAQEKLRNAKIYESVEKAVEDLDYVAGTKPGKGVGLKEFTPRENTSIMIGRESSGLSNQELELCDTVIHIETSGYSSLNQSHATAVIMHQLSKTEKQGMNRKTRRHISNIINSEILEELVLRSNPSQSEAEALIGELNQLFDSQ
ncbi:MAG: RNA methyltransferase [Candidatus Nanohaloarchaea archaeon]